GTRSWRTQHGTPTSAQETSSAPGPSGLAASSSTATAAGCKLGMSSSSRSRASASCAAVSLDSSPGAGPIVLNDMENLMSIGEFASVSRLSQKALRLYGERGLLPPAWVDPAPGYRYHTLEQVPEATLTALLRRGGMPLAEIRASLREPSVELLEEYE